MNVKQVNFALASLSQLAHLVPVSIEYQQTGIIRGLPGLQSLNALSQFILDHLQTIKPKGEPSSMQGRTEVQFHMCGYKYL